MTKYAVTVELRYEVETDTAGADKDDEYELVYEAACERLPIGLVVDDFEYRAVSDAA